MGTANYKDNLTIFWGKSRGNKITLFALQFVLVVFSISNMSFQWCYLIEVWRKDESILITSNENERIQ